MKTDFDVWMEEVKEEFAILVEGCVSIDDIADWGYWDGWNDGMSPADAARMAAENDTIMSQYLELMD